MQKIHLNNIHPTTVMETEVARRCILISIITVVYAHVSCSAASCSVQTSLQPRLQTEAATTELQ
jgi:hypothetical protein